MGRYYHVLIVAELNIALPPLAVPLVEYLLRLEIGRISECWLRGCEISYEFSEKDYQKFLLLSHASNQNIKGLNIL